MTYRDTLLAMVPRAYYRLGEPSGSAVMSDETAAYPGSYQGAVSVSAPGLLVGDANTAFSCLAGYAAVPALGATTDWSLTWLATPNLPIVGYRGWFSGGGADMVDVYTLAPDLIAFNDGVMQNVTTLTAGPAHWAITYQAGLLTVYRNAAVVYRSMGRGHGLLNVGKFIGTAGGVTADTVLDEEAIFFRAITATEVAALYASSIGTSVTTQLVTVAQVKARIGPGIGATDTTDDALISELIAEVSAFIQEYTGRRFTPETATYVFDTYGGYVLRVPRGIRAITSMGVNNTQHQPDTGGSYTTVPVADQLLRPKAEAGGVEWPYTEVWISRGALAGTISRFGTVQNGCTITGDFGWAAVPQDIQGVTIDAVVAAYQTRGLGASGVIGADALAVAPWASFFGKGSPQRATMDRYRYWGMA